MFNASSNWLNRSTSPRVKKRRFYFHISTTSRRNRWTNFNWFLGILLLIFGEKFDIFVKNLNLVKNEVDFFQVVTVSFLYFWQKNVPVLPFCIRIYLGTFFLWTFWLKTFCRWTFCIWTFCLKSFCLWTFCLKTFLAKNLLSMNFLSKNFLSTPPTFLAKNLLSMNFLSKNFLTKNFYLKSFCLKHFVYELFV